MDRETLQGLGYTVEPPGLQAHPIYWTMSPPNARGHVEFATTEDFAWEAAARWAAAH